MWRVIAVLLGLWVGAVGLVVHRQVWAVGGVSWPWGLVVVLATTAVVLRGLATGPRLGGAWFLLGWVPVLIVPVLLAGDSQLVPADSLAWIYVLGSAGLIVFDVVRASRVDQ